VEVAAAVEISQIVAVAHVVVSLTKDVVVDQVVADFPVTDVEEDPVVVAEEGEAVAAFQTTTKNEFERTVLTAHHEVVETLVGGEAEIAVASLLTIINNFEIDQTVLIMAPVVARRITNVVGALKEGVVISVAVEAVVAFMETAEVASQEIIKTNKKVVPLVNSTIAVVAPLVRLVTSHAVEHVVEGVAGVATTITPLVRNVVEEPCRRTSLQRKFTILTDVNKVLLI